MGRRVHISCVRLWFGSQAHLHCFLWLVTETTQDVLPVTRQGHIVATGLFKMVPEQIDVTEIPHGQSSFAFTLT
jgi:hypothetical protein